VAKNEAEALEKAREINSSLTLQDLKQDEDCLDTWFSSWLWPIEVFKGYSNPGNADFNYYYPTSTLVTAPEIIFFWVARMIMAGFEYEKKKPFNDVYFTGIVRDKMGRKMSKSLGNSPDLLELIDKYGADAVRFGIMIASPAGNDLLWDESSNEQGRNFNNKIWNALKLVKGWANRTTDMPTPASAGFAISWFRQRLNATRQELDKCYDEFRLSEALKITYSLIWDDFCSWYLEWIKPGMEERLSREVYEATVEFFEELMQLLHPVMPFITEEIYHQLRERAANDDLTIRPFNSTEPANEAVLANGLLLQQAITALRDAKTRNNIKPKEWMQVFLETEQAESYQSIAAILQKQVNAASIEFGKAPAEDTITVVVGKDRFHLLPEQPVDTEAQKAGLQKELEYLKGFLAAVEKKLSNERFVQNAQPAVVELERKKKQDAEDKIKIIEQSLGIAE
ncbi:MAG TPA: class I tRNA ligase family protein, partial [Chitinophagaceae bacterium]|nr:class I tRNA ligase family protein [Chitinophagaceae bacterium]